MKIKFGYLVGLLFLVVFTVTLLNHGTIREKLEGPSCPAGYRYAGGSNTCIPSGGGPFICPSGNTMIAGGNGDKSCIPNERVQEAVASGRVTVVNSPPAPSCPAGYRYAGGSNTCIPSGGGPFICPSGNTMIAGGNGDKSCIPNERVQEAVASGRVTVVNSPPAPTRPATTSAPPQQHPTKPQGVPSCDIEKFAAY